MHVKDKSLVNDINLMKFDYFCRLVYKIFGDACYKLILKVFFQGCKEKRSIKARAERCCSSHHSRCMVMQRRVTQR